MADDGCNFFRSPSRPNDFVPRSIASRVHVFLSQSRYSSMRCAPIRNTVPHSSSSNTCFLVLDLSQYLSLFIVSRSPRGQVARDFSGARLNEPRQSPSLAHSSGSRYPRFVTFRSHPQRKCAHYFTHTGYQTMHRLNFIVTFLPWRAYSVFAILKSILKHF